MHETSVLAGGPDLISKHKDLAGLPTVYYVFIHGLSITGWTGNRTHERLLRPALELHATWAQECFDDDKNGLYVATSCSGSVAYILSLRM